MQQLHKKTIAPKGGGGCAAEILDAVPEVMCFIRTHMRRHRGTDLSVPQFRALVFLNRNPGASLSAVAEYLGLSSPAASRLVEGLVRKRLVERQIPAGNRRLVALSINARGGRTVSMARQATEKELSKAVAALPPGDRAAIHRALRVLREKFSPAVARWQGKGGGK